MSAAVRATGFRIARQFTLAVTLCAAVVGGAVATAMPVDSSVSRQVVAGSADNNWPTVPVTPQDNNWPTTPTTPQDNNWPSNSSAL
ncbi:hypothetical protein [Streptomyces coeruleorubidus]|uniref:Serine protease n=1 Tax=Streptomyces coeruleorubidus TaxID=116188 RepID=A0ABZ0KMF8_STRC4|nr:MULTISPECIES: hypothetical protein [Streptomyces]WOT39008.1 hypothetical protein R5U08_34795 [Streptomyces coeruleorubidus]GGT95694.1 hypothetical protein GCM10010244_21010 [Streptomyces bellus]